MSIEPFFRGAATYNEAGLALNLGILYKSTSSVINVALAINPVYFLFDSSNTQKLIHFAHEFATSGPGLVTLYGPSPTIEITDIGDVIEAKNQRIDITDPTQIIPYENTVVANVGTNLIHKFHIGVLKETGGGRDSEGGEVSSHKVIINSGYPFVIEFDADFDNTECQWQTAFFEKDPLFPVGQS